MATDQSDDPAPSTVSEHAQLEKLERLEREYIRLTLTQNKAEVRGEGKLGRGTTGTTLCTAKH